MNPRSLSFTYTVARTPDEVLETVTDVRAWWHGDVSGETARVGDVFEYHYEDIHYSRIRVAEVLPTRVVWTVVDNHLSFVEDQEEWVGTDIVFAIEPVGSGSRVTFTHDGLVPEFECYDACRQGWTMYAAGTLRELLESDV